MGFLGKKDEREEAAIPQEPPAPVAETPSTETPHTNGKPVESSPAEPPVSPRKSTCHTSTPLEKGTTLVPGGTFAPPRVSAKSTKTGAMSWGVVSAYGPHILHVPPELQAYMITSCILGARAFLYAHGIEKSADGAWITDGEEAGDHEHSEGCIEEAGYILEALNVLHDVIERIRESRDDDVQWKVKSLERLVECVEQLTKFGGVAREATETGMELKVFRGQDVERVSRELEKHGHRSRTRSKWEPAPPDGGMVS